MNYRHAFHAGNFADCAKHALLLWLLDALKRKPAPFFVLDTHAGVGRYDLIGGGAARTGEWRDGIARLLHDTPPPLQRYVEAVSAVGAAGEFIYPGSPLLIYQALRETDRLGCCELHPDDAAALRALFRGESQAGVHRRDGYEAVRALLPPRERRGLVLIDPPYEAAGEFERVIGALKDGAGRFNHGIYAAWYPIKHRAPVTTFLEAVQWTGLRDVVAAELWLRRPIDPAVLNGCGLLVRNPPHGFEAAAQDILAALAHRLGGPDAGSAVLRVTDE
ncbi:MAG: 23S rRNA (adenine(2030)-N(6))-methyltransferase RlmJ [Acetobacteraceae bacterium]|nr:23S rRNA (adenine(2030)-N(6))-methyltransferase RlmJ [Acetobacteraceae bacterium]